MKLAHIQYERVIMWLELFILFAMFVGYIACISISVVQIVLRKELAVSIRETQAEVSNLESEYFAKQNDISIDKASEFALVKKEPAMYLELNHERISRRP